MVTKAKTPAPPPFSSMNRRPHQLGPSVGFNHLRRDPFVLPFRAVKCHLGVTAKNNRLFVAVLSRYRAGIP